MALDGRFIQRSRDYIWPAPQDQVPVSFLGSSMDAAGYSSNLIYDRISIGITRKRSRRAGSVDH